MKYTTKPIKWVHTPEGHPLFSELATEVEIEDEAAGEFVVIRQIREDSSCEIRIDAEEWKTLRSVIDKAVKLCQNSDKHYKSFDFK